MSNLDVEIKIDGEEWEEATLEEEILDNSYDWSYEWDTTEWEDDEYIITVRAYDETEYSTEESITLHIENEEEEEEEEEEVEEENAAWTFMVYMSDCDLEEFAISDINEMESVGSSE